MNAIASSTHSRGRSIFLGILLLLAGLLSIAGPLFAGIAASVFFGWLILFAGVAHPWSERGAGAVLWQVLIGIVYVIAAFYMLVLPVAGVAALTLVLVLYIALEGVFELAVFALLRRLSQIGLVPRRWRDFGPACRPHLLSLAVELVLGVGPLAGISLLLSGIARLTFPMRLRAV